MTLVIDVTEPMHLRREAGNLIIRRARSELVVPSSDVQFMVEMAAGEVPVVKSVPRPVSSGNSCFACGGMTVRTGTCETCVNCGTTGGCG